MPIVDIDNDTTKQDNVNRIAEKHDYDVDKLDEFISVVFPQLDEDEYILTWMSNSNIPSYPTSDDELLNKLDRVPLPKALYFATSTARKDEKDNKLYNRKALFKRLCVVVLDDIGTKIPVEKIPAEFKPTYIIESSKGNFQYGYVLAEPIAELELAEALIELVYSSGVSDKGGKMVNKLVRLPDGINGKKGEKGKFHVKLHELNAEQLWTPEAIIDALGLPVEWDAIKKDAKHATLKTRIKTQGAAVWSPLPAQSASLNGVIDPLYEWILEEGMVKQESNDWMMIRCPWHDMHTSGGDEAYYSPLGVGVNEFKKLRSFKCFHEHCAGHDTEAFMEELITLGSPIVPRKELNPELFRDYVYDPVQNGLWRIKADSPPLFMPVAGAQNVLVNKIELKDEQGKVKRMKEIQYFLNAHHKVVVHGVTYDPSTPNIVIKDKHGVPRLNQFYTPDWGDGAYDEKIVQQFLDYISYLMPEEKDQNFFLDWLAAKCQNMGFRGQAIIMVAVMQGMGRTTLSKLVGRLIGDQNMESVPFEILSGDGQFNEWQTKPMIVTDETLALAKDDSIYKVYERLKEKVDTTPKKIRVNPKFGSQREQMSYSSFLMFSNHMNAIHVAQNDRRFRVIINATKPASPEYFKSINDMLDADEDKHYWARHVWRFLRQRKVKPEELLKPAEMTSAKEQMILANMSPLDVVLHTIFENWPFKLITVRYVKRLVEHHLLYLGDVDNSARNRVINKLFRESTMPIHNSHKYRIDGQTSRISYLTHNQNDQELVSILTDDPIGKTTMRYKDQLEKEFPEKFDELCSLIKEALEFNDLI